MITKNSFSFNTKNVSDVYCIDIAHQLIKSGRPSSRFYQARFVVEGSEKKTGHLYFNCLKNYHMVEGDTNVTCHGNGSWNGVEPRCKVNAFWEKRHLGPLIAFVSFIIPFVWLIVDFYCFVHDRRKRRAVSYRPIAQRTRVQGIGTHISKFDIARDILNTIMSTTDFDEGPEDIFQNKTAASKPVVVKRNSHEASQFQLIGAARAFGHIGRILQRDMFH